MMDDIQHESFAEFPKLRFRHQCFRNAPAVCVASFRVQPAANAARSCTAAARSRCVGGGPRAAAALSLVRTQPHRHGVSQ
eukprot:6205127-Pleurochrysis_carterae.AAC.2